MNDYGYDFLANPTKSMFTDKEYEKIYLYFRDSLNIRYTELFVLNAAIGYKNNLCIPLKKKGKEFKSSYFGKLRFSMYSMILNHHEYGKNIEDFKDVDFQNSVINYLQELANGGMKILCDKVFLHNWDGLELDTSYDEYLIDVLTYSIEETEKVPF